MGQMVAGLASSHAFTFMEPKNWDEFREKNRAALKRRHGIEAPVHPRVNQETTEENERRYARIRVAIETLRGQLADEHPDALIVIGDDQNENFSAANMPQLAVYVGPDFESVNRFSKSRRQYRSHSELARTILERGTEDGFDIASLGSFTNNELVSHAHTQVLEEFSPYAEIPVVLVFINAIHYPAIQPSRCFAFGKMLAHVIGERPASEKVALCASGGLSHFTAGYPWKNYSGPFSYGEISEDFDRQCLEYIQAGAGHRLAELTYADLLAHGHVETRSWIALLGAIGETPPQMVVYEPFYRAIMGMAVASWSLEASEIEKHSRDFQGAIK